MSYGAARDITEQKRAAEFRERFLGIVAHDLRTPLSAIATGASLLLRFDTMPEGALRVARRISSSARGMSRMISVEVSSAPQGTTFVVRPPFAPTAAPAPCG